MECISRKKQLAAFHISLCLKVFLHFSKSKFNLIILLLNLFYKSSFFDFSSKRFNLK